MWTEGIRSSCTLALLSTDLEIWPKKPEGLFGIEHFYHVLDKPEIDRSTKFQSFIHWFMPRLGVSELEKVILNVSGEIEKLVNYAAHGLLTLQK